jgi:hypothetical protein
MYRTYMLRLTAVIEKKSWKLAGNEEGRRGWRCVPLQIEPYENISLLFPPESAPPPLFLPGSWDRIEIGRGAVAGGFLSALEGEGLEMVWWCEFFQSRLEKVFEALVWRVLVGLLGCECGVVGRAPRRTPRLYRHEGPHDR